MKCPCNPNIPYSSCCQAFHEGKEPPTALALMKSRYSAYALNIPEYIIKTTDPRCPEYSLDFMGWKRKIETFSNTTTFEKLTIVEEKKGDPFSTVIFTAHLRQGSHDVSFTEKSLFEKVNGNWKYLSGEFLS